MELLKWKSMDLYSDETKEKNRVAHLGKKASKETKTKLSLAKLGEKKHFYGKQHSEDSRRKMSESQQRRFSKSI